MEESGEGRPFSEGDKHKKWGTHPDDLDNKNSEVKLSRREFLARTASVLAAATTAVALGKPRKNPSDEDKPYQPDPLPTQEIVDQKLANDIVFLARNEQGGLEYSSNVVQYYDVTFSQLGDNLGNPIPVRNEHKQDSSKVEKLTGSDMNDHEIGAIRVAGVNHDNDRPQDSFVDIDKNYVYEWLVLVRLTDDPDHPYVYVDGNGDISDQPWFISPNYATLDLNSHKTFNISESIKT